MALTPHEVPIPRPCEASFSAMSEVPSGRHCNTCDKTVHDLARLTERDARALIAGDERVCVRYSTTPAGTVRTAPEPLVPPGRLLAKVKPLMLAASALAASACGPAVDALPDAVLNRMSPGVYLGLRHPADFLDCLTTPGCDPFMPMTMGAPAPAPPSTPPSP